MFRMHTAHLANVSKSVTKNATFPRTGGLPCLITLQLHLLQLLGDSFSLSQQPPIWEPPSHYSMILNVWIEFTYSFVLRNGQLNIASQYNLQMIAN